MSNLNKLKFDNYPLHSYFKTNEKAERTFPSILKFPNALGFDLRSEGYIVMHKNHQNSGIEQEIPACLFLKDLGRQVELIEEYNFKASGDALVDECFFEIKRISKAIDVTNAIMAQFKRCEKKSPHLILHIDQRIEPSNLKRALRKASERYDKIKKMTLIVRRRVIDLDKEMIQKGSYYI